MVMAHEVFVAEGEGALVGACLASAGADGTGEVSWVFVEAGWRRRGLGQKLVEAAMAYLAVDRQCKAVRVYVVEGNKVAEKLYETLGFRRMGSVWEVRS